MADPLSVTASVLAVASAALISIRSLCETVKSFQNRNKTLGRLQANLQDLITILDSLVHVINADISVLTLLEGPIERCKNVCNEFEQSIKKFHGTSKVGLLDWTKLEFMRGDIHDFIDTIDGYKSTITVGLGSINLRTSQISHEALQQYQEMIKDTAENLELHLQQIDEKLTRYDSLNTSVPDTSIDLHDERTVTQQCLRVCKDASSYIESLARRESTLLQEAPEKDARDDTLKRFEAQVLVRQAFDTTQASLLRVIHCLGERLQSTVLDVDGGNEKDRARLKEDVDSLKDCLQVCKMANEISYQKIHRVGEAIAEEDSDQVVVTTLADLFDVGKATSRNRSAQLVATLTPDNFEHVVDKRYNSRFGALPDRSIHSHAGSTTSPITSSLEDTKKSMQSTHSDSDNDLRSSRPEGRSEKPSPNETRRRYGDANGG